MCNFTVDLAAEASRFGLPVALFECNLAGLDEVAGQGLIERDGWHVTVTPLGQLVEATLGP